MFRKVAVATAAALVLTGLAAAPSVASPPTPSGDDRLAVYSGTVDSDGLAAIVELGVDRGEIVTAPSADGSGLVDVQVILSGGQVDALAAGGTDLQVQADPSRQRRSLQRTGGVFRTYIGDDGILKELQAQAAAHPKIAEFRVIGETVQGTPIGAVRVTKNVAKAKDGKKPATVYVAAQHAREWITPEMVRRLLDLYLSEYGTDDRITDLVDDTELWFVPVANPDGYDFTFEDGQRLWRKNLRDNDGNGEITVGDGVDLNRNSATRWGYDNEGSSPNPASDTYRGPSPASEPETQALDGLFADITPQFMINYHSAAELLLHGIGWQVATPSPDDVIYEAMVGDDENPAVPGYDPDISAELYTTNGDLDSHMQEAHGTLGFTPEMSTCEAAVNSVPDDEWTEDDCQFLGFDFPDDEALIQAEFEKNIPFALAVAESAIDPDDPVSVVGRDAEDFRVDSFTVSYGDPQTVAVWAKKALKAKKMTYTINGGRPKTVDVTEWAGGERYGSENVDYYAEYRGVVTGARPGDHVEVWFKGTATGKDIPKGQQGAGPRESEHFTYEVAQDTGNSVLIVANEDYTGVNPTYPAGTDAPKYIDEYADALLANGVTPDVWDVDAQGVPHDLGVLGHYDTVLWYLGDNRLTQDPEDELTQYGSAQLPDLAVAERQQYLTIAMRDYLNEGGKVAYAGETTAYYGLGGSQFGGIYYGLDGHPDQECVVTTDPGGDCLLLADDFTQYWMGAYDRIPLAAEGVAGTAEPLDGFEAIFGGPATVDNPIDEVGAFTPTSERLPVADFPQFESWAAADYTDVTGRLVAAEGALAAAATHVDDGYQRLGRTFDLTGVTAADAPTFEAQIAYDLEEGYDNVIVEVRPVGSDDWTTLPDLDGNTSTAVPTECEAGFYMGEHPQLEHYLTLGDPCVPTGTTGQWNSFTGASGGWIPVAFDLSAYAGKDIEVVVSYVTDPSTGGAGLIVDDTRLVVAGAPTQAEGFEAGFGAWSVLGAPDGSPANAGDFEIADGLGDVVAVTATPDTLLFGFGLEQLESDAARADVVARILAHFAG
ncbi:MULTISPECIES: M14 family metallopeptidase [Microbacterium]|uniref:Zinc carboxypeptidase n=1 Tax=Microbacterium trichothecenolyticum TaxID=69370 RepID=A0A0M2HEM3_MICTR|nr:MULTISPECIES: M14 family metallopeptidase [Microbacterium]KJL45085.1 Zinc carboxypeptidase precursor [Microbacterium trichothecenolyticum]MDR7191110.1 murein tripeptide amidase MpaA [Microbacterium sp. BE35]